MADERRPTDPKVGPADPETRRRMIEQQIREGAAERRRKEQQREEERKPETFKPSPRDVPMGSGMAGGARRAVAGRQQQIDRAVDEAVTGRRSLEEARRPKY